MLNIEEVALRTTLPMHSFYTYHGGGVKANKLHRDRWPGRWHYAPQIVLQGSHTAIGCARTHDVPRLHGVRMGLMNLSIVSVWSLVWRSAWHELMHCNPSVDL